MHRVAGVYRIQIHLIELCGEKDGDPCPVLLSGCPAVSDACDSAPLGQFGADHPRLAEAAAVAAVAATFRGEVAELAVGIYKAGRSVWRRLKYGSTPEGRPFTKHYVTETGPKRNIPGSVVDHTINNTEGIPAGGGKTVHFDPENNITVVTGDGESIVSVHKGPPRQIKRIRQ